MSQPFPVDILSDSDSDPGCADNRLVNFNDDAIDLITPPPDSQSKKKQRIDTLSNPSHSNLFFIDDDDPTPSKQNPSSIVPTSSSTPSFIAETPFSDASIVKCSKRKSSFSGEGLATGQLVVAETPMSEVLRLGVPVTKRDAVSLSSERACSLISNHKSTGEGLATDQLVVADTPMSEVLRFGVPVTKRNAVSPSSEHACSLISNHKSTGEGLATGQLVVADTPMSEVLRLEVPITKRNAASPSSEHARSLISYHKSTGEGLATDQLVVADTPMSEVLRLEVPVTKRNAASPSSEHARSLISYHKSTGEGLATDQLVVADTPMSEVLRLEVPVTKRNAALPSSEHARSLISYHKSTGEGLATDHLLVADTLMSEVLRPGVPVTKRNAVSPSSEPACSLISNHKSTEINDPICVESDNESESLGGFGDWTPSGSGFAAKSTEEPEFGSRFVPSPIHHGSVQSEKPPTSPVKTHMSEDSSSPGVSEDDICVAYNDSDDKAGKMDPVKERTKVHQTMKPKKISKEERIRLMEEKKQLKEQEKLLKAASKAAAAEKKKHEKELQKREKEKETMRPKKISKEERIRLMEEKKQLKEQEKLFKAASKAKAAEIKKHEKELQKREKGNDALKSIRAEIDKNVVELGSKEERIRLVEEKKQLKEQEKLLKAASKAEAAEIKKHESELQKWEKGKYALKSIRAEIDKNVVELGSIEGEGLATDQLVDADTLMSETLGRLGPVTKHNAVSQSSERAWSLISNHKSTEINDSICVESDDESESLGRFGDWKPSGSVFAAKSIEEPEFGPRFVLSPFHLGSVQSEKPPTSPVKTHMLEDCSSPGVSEDGIRVVGFSNAYNDSDDKAGKMDTVKERKKVHQTMKPKKISKEERMSLMEEKKQLIEQEKLLKAASKAEAAEIKKREKELQKWEKGKYALKSIRAEIDKNVVELGSIGGHLLTRFAEKGISYCITSNPVERTIVWTMVVPEEISTIASERIEISYVLIVYDAEEFCQLVSDESLMDHVQSVQNHYPHHTVCYVTNRLMAYINKREQAKYKNPANYAGWKRPAIEEVLAKLATHFCKVHSRQCVDESELAEHVVGLTCSLASCQFRKKLTRLSVNANGSFIPKDCIDKNLIKKNVWLKALVAIPKVQPRFAIAVWKKYPTMKSLLSVYMDPTKSVHEKEFLLKDLSTEALLGGDRRLGEVCSKRIYRILMAQRGNIKTDDVENGADFFGLQST